MALHEKFDRLWLNDRDRRRARLRAYAWLRDMLGITKDECHIAMFDVAMCARASAFVERKLKRIAEGFPDG